MPFEIGQVAGDYEILGVLGKGGMGRVYRVRNVISNRVEAMKVLLADVAAEAELGDRFLGEIRTLARLDHPNIAKLHAAFKVENQFVMVMEFIEGLTLADRAKQGAVPLDEVLSYITQTLAALAYAHQNGVIHRDIKPSNIMVTPHGIVKLMDFGIAKSEADPQQTRPGTTMGSMLYMSPEQVRGATVDPRSDLYSVGVVLYELTAGRRPFEAENTFAILEAQLNTVPKPPLELNPSLPPALNEIILTALAKEPMRRFQNADAFRNALENVRSRPGSAAALPQTQAQPAQAPIQPGWQAANAGSPVLVAKKGNRGLWMALGAIACVCVLAGGAVLLPHFWKSSAAAKPAAVDRPVPAAVQPTPISQQDSSPVQTASPVTTPPPTPGSPAPNATIPSSVTYPAPQQPKTSQTKSAVQPQLPSPTQGQPAAPAVVPPPSPNQQTLAASQAPSQAEIDAASENLMKLRSRADAVKSSLDNLRTQQAASGLGLRQDIVSSASRMESYLQAADRALQNNSLDSAHKSMDRAEEELNKLEAFFGR